MHSPIHLFHHISSSFTHLPSYPFIRPPISRLIAFWLNISDFCLCHRLSIRSFFHLPALSPIHLFINSTIVLITHSFSPAAFSPLEIFPTLPFATSNLTSQLMFLFVFLKKVRTPIGTVNSRSERSFKPTVVEWRVLTKFVADAVVLQQCGVLECVPAVENLSAACERSDTPQS